jgi:hypothetical protein
VTVYLGDFSNHDRARKGGPIPFASIRAAGYTGALHKLSEGAWTDPFAAEASANMNAANFPVAGVYHVLWPAQTGQAAYVWGQIKALFPWLLDHPAPVMMCDAEIFQEFTPFRAPTVTECHRFLDEFRLLSGWQVSQLPVYAPMWVYGNAVSQFRYPWVSSKYVPGCGPYKSLYPGDGSSMWAGPKEPLWLQYTACATVDGLTGSDANAARYPNETAFAHAIRTGGDPDMPLDPADPIVVDIRKTLDEVHEWVRILDFGTNNGGANPYAARGELTDKIRDINADTNSLITQVGNIASTLTALVIAVSHLPNAAQITAAVLAALPADLAQQVAAAVVAALPSTLAASIVDEIAARLKVTLST